MAINKNKNQASKKKNPAPKPKPAAPYTPFKDVGKIIGSAISDFTGVRAAKSIGKWLGSGIGSIFGSGDYVMVGNQPTYNVLAGSVPQFSTSNATNIVCHREYLGDIFGTTSFTNTAYAINPGVLGTFPWLSTVAQNYQQYRIHGMVFEFRPLTTDFANSGVPGVVIMSTNYNAASPVYGTKQQMENAEYAVSVKPTEQLIHLIECDPRQTIDPIKYVRSGAVPSGQDARLYDWGTFQFATQNNSSSVDLGELWVSYCVELFKPVILDQVGGGVNSFHLFRSSVDNTHPCGTTTAIAVGNVSNTPSATAIAWTGASKSIWMVTFVWNGSSATISAPSFTYTNCSQLTVYNNDTASGAAGPSGAVSSGTLIQSLVVQASNLTSGFGTLTLTLGTSGTLPTSGGVDIFITQMDVSITL